MYLKYALQKLVIVILGIYKVLLAQGRNHYNSEIKRDYFKEYNKRRNRNFQDNEQNL